MSAMDRLKSGYREAESITKKHAKTFYLASRFLPEDKKLATYSIYAICRIADESVDNPTDKAPKNLSGFKENIESAYSSGDLDDNLLLCFRETINRYNIPKGYFEELLEGMNMDLEIKRYRNFEEMEVYCYRVAGVVGLIMLKIFGYTEPIAEIYAVSLGIALQITNILRDIKEDFQRGRIYLPLDEMQRFGVCENDISSQKIDEHFKEFMKFQIKRARLYYAMAQEGISLIPESRSRLVASVAKELYCGILDSIEKNDYDIYTQRARVNKMKKLALVLRILLKR